MWRVTLMTQEKNIHLRTNQIIIETPNNYLYSQFDLVNPPNVGLSMCLHNTTLIEMCKHAFSNFKVNIAELCSKIQILELFKKSIMLIQTFASFLPLMVAHYVSGAIYGNACSTNGIIYLNKASQNLFFKFQLIFSSKHSLH